MRACVVEGRHPVAAHVGFDLGAVLAGYAGGRNRRAAVHHHAGHVHVEVKLDRADIHQFTAVGVAKLDEDVVHRFLQLAARMNEIDREVFDFLHREGRARHCAA